MNIFITHSRNFDFENELYKPLLDSSLNTRHKLFLPHKEKKEIATKEIIKNSDFVVAELSYPSTGQGIELGWAEAFGIPIIGIYKEGNEISGSVQLITKKLISYKDEQDMIAKLTAALDS